MPGEKTREDLNADLHSRLEGIVATFAEERGLTKEEVMGKVREMLFKEPPSEAET